MASRNIGQEILDGIREIKAFKKNGGYLRTFSNKKNISPALTCGEDGQQKNGFRPCHLPDSSPDLEEKGKA